MFHNFFSCLLRPTLNLTLQTLYPWRPYSYFMQDYGPGQNRRSFISECDFDRDFNQMRPIRDRHNDMDRDYKKL